MLQERYNPADIDMIIPPEQQDLTEVYEERQEKLQKLADLLSIRYVYKVVEWEEPFT